MPAALEAVCLKALAKKPDDRYATAKALADDVRALGWPTSRWRPTASRWRCGPGRWARRHRTAVTVAAALLVAGAAALGVSTVLVNRQRQRAEANFQLARTAVDDMYTQVAEKWLAQESRMEPVQRDVSHQGAAVLRAVRPARRLLARGAARSGQGGAAGRIDPAPAGRERGRRRRLPQLDRHAARARPPSGPEPRRARRAAGVAESLRLAAVVRRAAPRRRPARGPRTGRVVGAGAEPPDRGPRRSLQRPIRSRRSSPWLADGSPTPRKPTAGPCRCARRWPARTRRSSTARRSAAATTTAPASSRGSGDSASRRPSSTGPSSRPARSRPTPPASRGPASSWPTT